MHATEPWVDCEGGDDENSGTKEAPFATIGPGLARLQLGSNLHILPRSKSWPLGLRITVGDEDDVPPVPGALFLSEVVVSTAELRLEQNLRLESWWKVHTRDFGSDQAQDFFEDGRAEGSNFVVK